MPEISISVIIPAFNRPDELDRALRSLVLQTYRDFDVVVCDDGSTQDLRTVVESYLGKLNLQYVKIANSGTPGRPRNTAISLAKGNWLSFLDSDDWWTSDRLDCVVRSLVQGVDLIYHPLIVTKVGLNDSSLRYEQTVGRKPGADVLRDMIVCGNPIAVSGAVVRRDVFERIGGFAENLFGVEDFDAWLRLVEMGAKFGFIDRPLGYYWVGDGNMTRSVARFFESHRALFGKHLLSLSGKYQSLACTHFNYILGSYSLALGDHANTKQYFDRVRFSISPRRWLYAKIRLRTLRCRKV